MNISGSESSQKFNKSTSDKKEKDSIKGRKMGSASTVSTRNRGNAKESTKENVKEVTLKEPPVTAPEGANRKKRNSVIRTAGLEGYDLVDDFKTGPPVGWKRPSSTTSVMIRKMLDNRQNNLMSEQKKNDNNRRYLNKDIYFEAIYREDLGGQIFMKYLSAKRKTVSIIFL